MLFLKYQNSNYFEKINFLFRINSYVIQEFKNISFMDEKFKSTNKDNDELILDTQESDYKNLITRLKEINLNIGLLKKQYLDKL